MSCSAQLLQAHVEELCALVELREDELIHRRDGEAEEQKDGDSGDGDVEDRGAWNLTYFDGGGDRAYGHVKDALGEGVDAHLGEAGSLEGDR